MVSLYWKAAAPSHTSCSLALEPLLRSAVFGIFNILTSVQECFSLKASGYITGMGNVPVGNNPHQAVVFPDKLKAAVFPSGFSLRL